MAAEAEAEADPELSPAEAIPGSAEAEHDEELSIA